jgi:hypothetical protein
VPFLRSLKNVGPNISAGAAFTTPLIQHQLRRRSLTKQQLQVVVAVRHADDAAWMEPVLEEAEVASAEGRASLEVYVTGDAKHSVSDVEDAIDEKTPENVKRQLVVGRPDLRAIVGEACASTTGRLAIVGKAICVCGRNQPLNVLSQLVAPTRSSTTSATRWLHASLLLRVARAQQRSSFTRRTTGQLPSSLTHRHR